MKRVVSCAPLALALVLLALIALKAALAIDLGSENLSMHLPFAARRAHLLVGWQFQRPAAWINPLAGYYDGFPILADVVKGYVWRLSGWSESVNLFALASLLAFFAYVRLVWGVSLAWLVIGVLAVPAIQTAAASNYPDIPACAAFAIVLLSICDLYVRPDRFRRPARWVIMFAAAFVAAHISLKISGLVCVAMLALAWPVWRLLREKPWPIVIGYFALLFAAELVVAGNLIKNLIRFHNPAYPFDAPVLGIHLHGPVLHQQQWDLNQVYRHLPNFSRWLYSVTEFGGFEGREGAFNNGMVGVPADSPAFAMGGFFSFLVFASLAFFVLAVIKRRDRVSFVFAACVVLSVLVFANLPNAYDLRHGTFWMMILITSCLMLLDRTDLAEYLQAYRIVLFASLVYVTAVTGARSFIPTYQPAQNYVDTTGADALLRNAVTQPREVVCLEQGAGHFDSTATILFAPVFHAQLDAAIPYGIREGECAGLKTIAGWPSPKR